MAAYSSFHREQIAKGRVAQAKMEADTALDAIGVTQELGEAVRAFEGTLTEEQKISFNNVNDIWKDAENMRLYAVFQIATRRHGTA